MNASTHEPERPMRRMIRTTGQVSTARIAARRIKSSNPTPSTRVHFGFRCGTGDLSSFVRSRLIGHQAPAASNARRISLIPHRLFRPLLLQRPHLRKQPARAQQFGVRASLHDAPVIHHDDLLRMHDRR